MDDEKPTSISTFANATVDKSLRRAGEKPVFTLLRRAGKGRKQTSSYQIETEIPIIWFEMLR